jgi:hypothetical protein
LSDLSRKAWQSGWGDQLRALTPLGRIPAPVELAGTAMFLATDDAAHMTGSYMVADSGYNMVGAHERTVGGQGRDGGAQGRLRGPPHPGHTSPGRPGPTGIIIRLPIRSMIVSLRKIRLYWRKLYHIEGVA